MKKTPGSNITPAQVTRSLREIQKTYKNILDDSSTWVLDEAISEVERSFSHYRNEKRRDNRSDVTWGYAISHENPLRFNVAETLDGFKPIIDIYCDIKWDEQDFPKSQDLKVRIWSESEDLIFRDTMDSTSIFDQLFSPERNYKRRVITRLHFDKATIPPQKSIEYHPQFHIQVGGKALDYELCWHPKKFDLPRISYPPMELFLACQLIAINFFPSSYQEIKETLEWKSLLKFYQNTLLLKYYENCIELIKSGESLFELLDIRYRL
ncbi:MAG: hypothetical protein F9K28_07660 [Bacteroidetes bacterium]|nr:MAG: hypothetical protein F9K28_07660 [Bacteroidota bacterium]